MRNMLVVAGYIICSGTQGQLKKSFDKIVCIKAKSASLLFVLNRFPSFSRIISFFISSATLSFPLNLAQFHRAILLLGSFALQSPMNYADNTFHFLGCKLKPGFVITNEPGIYFIPALIEKWKAERINTDFINFDRLESYLDFGGIRLEDNILVTETGCEMIGDRIPVTPSEVEDIMG